MYSEEVMVYVLLFGWLVIGGYGLVASYLSSLFYLLLAFDCVIIGFITAFFFAFREMHKEEEDEVKA